jgi:hypothetical protein
MQLKSYSGLCRIRRGWLCIGAIRTEFWAGVDGLQLKVRGGFDSATVWCQRRVRRRGSHLGMQCLARYRQLSNMAS